MIDVEYFIPHPLLTNFYLGSRAFVRDYQDEMRRIPILIREGDKPISARRYFRSEKMLKEIIIHDH